ncbi:MAG: hypothetical protein ACYCTD_06670 [bacterium]
MKRKFLYIVTLILSFIILIFLHGFFNANVCFGLKNPFISPFKVKEYKNIKENPLNGLTLQAIVSTSNPDKNIAIINNEPYYAGSKIMGKTVVGITRKAVIIKLINGKIVKLILSKFEGFKK